jgi:4-carboxymuconolactone decarboxylase
VSRFPLVDESDLHESLRPLLERFQKAGMPVPVLYRTLANAPKMLRGWIGFAWSLRADAETDRGLRELAIMRIAQLTGAPYEWEAHWQMAERFGMSREQLAGLKDWKSGELFSDEQRLILSLTDELTTALTVSDETWAALMAGYSPSDIVELVLTVAFYSCVSRVLGAFGILPDHDPQDVLNLM